MLFCVSGIIPVGAHKSHSAEGQFALGKGIPPDLRQNLSLSTTVQFIMVIGGRATDGLMQVPAKLRLLKMLLLPR